MFVRDLAAAANIIGRTTRQVSGPPPSRCCKQRLKHITVYSNFKAGCAEAKCAKAKFAKAKLPELMMLKLKLLKLHLLKLNLPKLNLLKLNVSNVLVRVLLG